jgi:Zn-dependent peptidase ImmA (M78 family)
LKELEDLAGANGIAIVEGNLPGKERGRWYAEPRIIVLQAGMPLDYTRTTLGHELGHATHHHDMSTPDARIHYFQERQADEYAARLLISEESYRKAERMHGAHFAGIAHELKVTVELIHVWRDLWHRKDKKWPDNNCLHRSKRSNSRKKNAAKTQSDTS